MPPRLAGHTAIIPVDSGLAEAVARRMSRDGAQVVLVDSDAARGGRLAAAIEDEGHGAPAVFCLETGDEQDLDALAELVAELGRRPRAQDAGVELA